MSSRAKIASSATAVWVRMCDGMSAFNPAITSLAAASLLERSAALFTISAATVKLRLEPFGRPEIRQQPVLQRGFLRLIDDGIGLLGRHHEMSVLLHLQLGGFPPLLPIICDDIRHEHLLDLIKRGLPP